MNEIVRYRDFLYAKTVDHETKVTSWALDE